MLRRLLRSIVMFIILLNETTHCWFRIGLKNICRSVNMKSCLGSLSCVKQSEYVATTVDEDQTAQTKLKGHAHTDSSRAKISAANKGKTPWNVGRQHSEETKRRIAEKTKEAMERRKAEKIAKLGLTEEEFVAQQVKEKKEKSKKTAKGGLTEESRRKMSESAKKRWEDPEYRREYSLATKGKKNHSIETRNRISAAVKLKWTDEEYRSKAKMVPNKAMREKISATLKARWEDPEFRVMMLNKTATRSAEWRVIVSKKIREKWLDPSYRQRVTDSIRTGYNSSVARSRSRTSSRSRLSSEMREQMIQEKRRLRLEEREKKIKLKEAMKAAKEASKKKTLGLSLKELLGEEMWVEEKIKRRAPGTKLIGDDLLEKQLNEEWTAADLDDDDDDGEDEDDDDDDDDDYPVSRSSISSRPVKSALIEVYDEDGMFVGKFTKREYLALRNGGK